MSSEDRTRRLLQGIARVVRALRGSRGWSQRRLAREAGLNRPNLAQLEEGTLGDMRLSTAVRLSRALGISVALLLLLAEQGGIPPPPRRTHTLGMADRKQLSTVDLLPEVVDVDSLRPFPNNPRAGDQEAIEQSLVAHGQFRPLVVASDNVILAGNHTYAAILAIRDGGPEQWRGLLGQPDPEKWQPPRREEWTQRWSSVAITRLPIPSSAPQAAEILLVDNRTGDFSKYDEGRLAALLQEVAEQQGLAGTGYDQRALDKLLASLDAVSPPEEFPEVGDDLKFDHKCPQCGYRWSGRPAGSQA